MPKKSKITDNYLEVSFNNHMKLHDPVTLSMSPARTAAMKKCFFEGAASILSGLADEDETYVHAVLLGAQKEIDTLNEKG